jgi:hypothetical protein
MIPDVAAVDVVVLCELHELRCRPEACSATRDGDLVSRVEAGLVIAGLAFTMSNEPKGLEAVYRDLEHVVFHGCIAEAGLAN